MLLQLPLVLMDAILRTKLGNSRAKSMNCYSLSSRAKLLELGVVTTCILCELAQSGDLLHTLSRALHHHLGDRYKMESGTLAFFTRIWGFSTGVLI